MTKITKNTKFTIILEKRQKMDLIEKRKKLIVFIKIKNVEKWIKTVKIVFNQAKFGEICTLYVKTPYKILHKNTKNQ